ncbi:BtpA/SgcQ family protein [Amphibacillus sp. Q70]|uniref:BtpA/SgcQ family protein n=1 Tax=Amphibacillus sp. Q70 TaxID=3453416 RepID=UPI003F828C28
MLNKSIIGMIHLKPMPTSSKSRHSIDEITEFALKDLATLEEAGIEYAIVENVFDKPYSTEMNLELIVAYTHIFTILQKHTKIELGVNIHATSGVEEMVIASLCGAKFIRAESFVEYRHTMSGLLTPMSAKLTRKRRELDSDVKIFADVNVKESRAVYDQTIEEAIADALVAEADAIIVTGLETGKPPVPAEIKELKKVTQDCPLLIGSGVSEENIGELMEFADGAIIGSSIKEDGLISHPVSLERVKKLLDQMN